MTDTTQETMNPADTMILNDLELCERYSRLQYLEDEIYSEKVAIREEFKARTIAKNENSILAGDKFTVTRFKKTTFKTTLEEARNLGATKTEEKPDSKKLKTLHEAGVDVPGTVIVEDVRITEIKE
jgi:hypothetical protein